MIIRLMVVKDGRSVNKKMKRKAFKVVILYIVLCMVSGCGSINESNESNTSEVNDMESGQLSGTIPTELEYIPENYETPAKQQGTINKLTYETWESFSYEDHSQPLEKNAWVYLPYGYSNDQKYITNLPSSLNYFEIRGSGEITITATIPSAVSSILVSSPILNIASFGENTNIPSINIISQNEELTIVSLNSIKTISFSYPETIKKLTCKSCNSLENLEFSQLENLEEIMDSSFQKVKLNTISFPSKLKVIESNCFTNCNSLKSISIPISCKQVGSLSFSNCEKLQTLEIPISTQFVEESTTYDEIYTNIVKDAFKSSPIKTITIYGSGELIYILMNQISNQFSGLETITLKEGITNIGENAFVELSTLTTLNIPSTVEFISGGAIQKCYNVEPIISIDNPFITYSEDVFYKIQNENKAKSLLTAIDNENSATSLLTAISRKDKNEFDIPEGVETIEKKAFYGNEFVETIILPYSTKSIGNSAFKKCPRLTKIIFKGIKEIEIEGSEIFDNPDQIVIKVPDEYEGNTLFGIEVERDPSIIPPIPDEDDSSSADEDNSLTPNEEEDSSTPNEEDDSSTQEKNDPSTIEEIDPPTPEENGLNGSEIAGIVIAVLIIVAVVSFLIYWFAIRKRKSGDSSESNIQNEVP